MSTKVLLSVIKMSDLLFDGKIWLLTAISSYEPYERDTEIMWLGLVPVKYRNAAFKDRYASVCHTVILHPSDR